MPGQQEEDLSAQAQPMSETQAMLKVVQNKIRNLRKAVDRASQLESAESRGEVLQADQIESLRSKPIKVALLSEFEEVLKKQLAAVADHSEECGSKNLSKDSKRESKRREKDLSESKPATTLSADDAGRSQGTLPQNGGDEVDIAVSDNSSKPALESTHEGETPQSKSENASLEKERENDGASSAVEKADEGAQVIARENPQDPAVELSLAVSKVLSLLHIVDYIRADDAKASVLAYFESQRGKCSGRHVGAYELDVLSYFTVMLSSPNGDIAHPVAIETSAAHCLAYLQESDAEAFTGTTYKSLAELVGTIATCPLLACRGSLGHILEEPGQTQLAFGPGGLVAIDAELSGAQESAGLPADSANSLPAAPAQQSSTRGVRRGGRRGGHGIRGRGRGMGPQGHRNSSQP